MMWLKEMYSQYTSIPQFELLPTREAFDAYLFAWVPSGPDVEISNNP